MNRIIMHVDLDYFYAQAEEVRKPELKGRPVAVGMFSGRSEFSGAIATANYEARSFGVKAGMPIAIARQKSKDLVLLKADREYYSQVSERIMELLRAHADKFGQVSIDEAYLDISEKTMGSFAEAKKLAQKIKEEILGEEKITCSIGIGQNKLIAKMASESKKPAGQTIVTPRETRDFLRAKRIADLHGIGDKTVEALSQRGINNIPKLGETSVRLLQEMFGEKKGLIIHQKSLGIDDSPVEERERQQLSRIVTLKEDTSDGEALAVESEKLAGGLAEKAAMLGLQFRTVAIILISKRLENITRSRTMEMPMKTRQEIARIARVLFKEFFSNNKAFAARRLGLRISGFQEADKQRKLSEFLGQKQG